MILTTREIQSKERLLGLELNEGEALALFTREVMYVYPSTIKASFLVVLIRMCPSWDECLKQLTEIEKAKNSDLTLLKLLAKELFHSDRKFTMSDHEMYKHVTGKEISKEEYDKMMIPFDLL